MVKRSKPTHHPQDYDLDIFESEDDLFRWFLLAYMLGKPIQSGVAVQTWKIFIERGYDTPWALFEASEQALSRMLVDGKYTRYNHIMARALKTMSEQIISMYEGSLLLMLQASQDEQEFSKRLRELHGIGPKTAEIIMRETDEFFARRAE